MRLSQRSKRRSAVPVHEQKFFLLVRVGQVLSSRSHLRFYRNDARLGRVSHFASRLSLQDQPVVSEEEYSEHETHTRCGLQRTAYTAGHTQFLFLSQRTSYTIPIPQTPQAKSLVSAIGRKNRNYRLSGSLTPPPLQAAVKKSGKERIVVALTSPCGDPQKDPQFCTWPPMPVVITNLIRNGTSFYTSVCDMW